jgi:hypothetical protein
MQAGWVGDMSLTWLRNNRTNYQKEIFTIVRNSSYHFSSVGTPEQIANKMRYFAHCNDAPFKGDVRDPNHIRRLIQGRCGFDINTPNTLKQVELNKNNTLPYIIDNKERFRHLFFDYYKK